MTRRMDKRITGTLLACFLAPVLLSVALPLLLASSVFAIVLWIITGVLTGLILVLLVLGRRAERAAYTQIAGQPGAVGAVIQNALRRSWTGSEMPVALNPRTKDAVYRVVGRAGVALIAEGPKDRLQRLLADEERNIKRLLPNVSIHTIHVGPDEDSTPLWQVSRTLLKLKSTLTKQEVIAVNQRLSSLKQQPVGIPKGIDPNKIRAPRMR